MPRFALVTGASSGIGEATAKLLASEGYSVALLARRREPLERVLAELPACEGGHVVVTCDLMDATSIASAAVEVSQIFGGLDLVVCNAGVGYRALVEELDDDLLDAVFATNVLGPMRLARELLPILRLSE
ncbi:MAG: NAD(P)-dependent dehydrogenase (short-subunit alcohol dehydrogenase family), partial [Planctomycetota bacterium]